MILAMKGTIFQNQGKYVDIKEDLSFIKEEEVIVYNNWEGNSLNMTLNNINEIAQIINNHKDENIIVVAGTDIFEELTFALACLTKGKTILITGSSKPKHIEGFDGFNNLKYSQKIISKLPNQVYVSMHNKVWGLKGFHKYSTEGLFMSDELVADNYQIVGNSSLLVPSFELKKIINKNILIIKNSLSIELNSISSLDGLVVEGSGTSSLSSAFIEELSRLTFPVILVSRAYMGDNFNEEYYPNSVAKYESKNINLNNYKEFNSIQARILLTLQLNAINS